MSHPSAFLLGLTLLAGSAWGALDFTPSTQVQDFEGVSVKGLAFRNGSDSVLYNPPADWTVEGAGPQLRMTPKSANLADIVFETRPLHGAPALDPSAVEKLKAEVAKSLPKEAEKVEWEAPEENPVLLNRHESRRVTVAYTAFAQRIKITAIICNFAEEQVVFRLSARDADFDKLYDLLRRSLYTWQGLK